MSFGQRLKQLRIDAGLTQSGLGEKLKLSKSNISKYESDDVEPNIQTLNDIARLFDVSADYLLGLSEVKDSIDNDLIDKSSTVHGIENLSEASKKELEQYIRLLKIKDELDKGKDEQSSALEKNA